MSAVSAGTSVVLIKHTGKYVKIYFNMKITFSEIGAMSLVWQGRGVSLGTLVTLGVVGSRSLGGSSSLLRVSDPFPITAPSFSCSDPPSQLQPQFHQGAGVSDAVCALLEKKAIKIAPPSPGFYSRLFVTPKVTGG